MHSTVAWLIESQSPVDKLDRVFTLCRRFILLVFFVFYVFATSKGVGCVE